jgi:hypothetical protein
MNSPPSQVGGLRVIAWSPVDARHTDTGHARHLIHGEVVPSPRALAICSSDADPSVYLFRCDSDWNVLADTWHKSFDDAQSQAEHEFEGVSATWHDVT